MRRWQRGDVAAVAASDPVYGGVFGTINDVADDGRTVLLWVGGDETVVCLTDELEAVTA